VRTPILVLLLAGGVAAAAYFVLVPDTPGPSALRRVPNAPSDPATTAHEAPIPTPAAFGSLVVRVKLADGKDLPEGTTAGYRHLGARHMKGPGSDGTFRFGEVPVTTLEVLAQAPGYEGDPVTVTLVADTPTEALIVLRAVDPGPK